MNNDLISRSEAEKLGATCLEIDKIDLCTDCFKKVEKFIYVGEAK